jgi:SAM-dependent methyltransferase
VYTDSENMALYDQLSGWDSSNDFYHALVMGASSVLDVGCGTGRQLHRARDDGHTGRLVGLDPDTASLQRARSFTDTEPFGIEWVQATAAESAWDEEFDLAIMMSHAFQCLVTDEELHASLAAIHASLRPDGRLVFETRNPAVREWERWTPENGFDITDAAGRDLHIFYRIESVVGDVVTFDDAIAARGGDVLRVDRGILRFLDVEGLDDRLDEAGFEVEHRYGGWDRGALTASSPEIITIARRS